MIEYVKWLDGSSKVVKVVLALPFFDWIIWGLYRLFKGAYHNDIIGIVCGIIWLCLGWSILWIVDIITLVMTNSVILD